MCVCLCVCSCVHVYVHVRACVCMGMCMCVHVCMHVCVCMCVHVCMHVCVHVYAYIHAHMFMWWWVHMCMCVYICIHVCLCTCIQRSEQDNRHLPLSYCTRVSLTHGLLLYQELLGSPVSALQFWGSVQTSAATPPFLCGSWRVSLSPSYMLAE